MSLQNDATLKHVGCSRGTGQGQGSAAWPEPAGGYWGFTGTVWYCMLYAAGCYCIIVSDRFRQHKPMRHWSGLRPIHVNINLPMSLASSPILTSPIFANVENVLGGEANVTDANSIPGSTRQHTNPIKPCLTHLALSDSLMHCNIHQRRTFWGWRLCTAARISGVGIISCQRHYSITMVLTWSFKMFNHQTSTLWVLPRWRWVK